MIKNSNNGNNKQVNSNLKYLSRCHYYGKLVNWEYVSEAMILVLNVYVASEYFGGTIPIRVYVPTEMEKKLINNLIVGDSYYVIAAPYKVKWNKKYQHRVDLLVNITQEVY